MREREELVSGVDSKEEMRSGEKFMGVAALKTCFVSVGADWELPIMRAGGRGCGRVGVAAKEV